MGAGGPMKSWCCTSFVFIPIPFRVPPLSGIFWGLLILTGTALVTGAQIHWAAATPLIKTE
jgi:hypothetical protein